MQGPLSTTSVQEAGWRRAVVQERAKSGLHSHLPDAQYLATVYAALRSAATRLQRPSIRVRWRPCHYSC